MIKSHAWKGDPRKDFPLSSRACETAKCPDKDHGVVEAHSATATSLTWRQNWRMFPYGRMIWWEDDMAQRIDGLQVGNYIRGMDKKIFTELLFFW